jgi:CHAD domain-containing protein
LDRAAKALECADGELTEDIHTARQRYKEARAALRLMRDDLGDDAFKRENRCYRDLARPLAALRDATALVGCIDDFARHFCGRIDPRLVIAIRSSAAKRRRIEREKLMTGATLRDIAHRTLRARKHVNAWPHDDSGGHAVAMGLKRIYRNGRHAMETSAAVPTDAALHEWRKRAKDLRYVLELLECRSIDYADAFTHQAHTLTDLLGEDHDLAMLRIAAMNEFASLLRDDAPRVLALIDERRSGLQRESFALGHTLYRAKPREFVRCVLRR